MSDSLCAETVTITGHGGDEIEAYLARPSDGGSRGGVVVIHHMPGYDRATKEITRRFAELGYDAVCPNLYWREAPGAAPDDAAATARAQGGVPDERLIGDVGGAPERHTRRRRRLLWRVCHGHASGGLPPPGDQPRRPAPEPARAAARPVRQRGLLPQPGAGRRTRRDPHAGEQAA